MPTKLFASAVPAEAHEHLAKVLIDGSHPHAECRAAPTGEVEVWSGPEARAVLEAAPVAAVPIDARRLRLDDDEIERIAARVAEIVLAKITKK